MAEYVPDQDDELKLMTSPAGSGRPAEHIGSDRPKQAIATMGGSPLGHLV